MSLSNTIKKRYLCARRIENAYGGFWMRYYLDEVYCHYVHGASPENYYVLRFFTLSDKDRSDYLTSGRSREVDRALNAKACARDKRIAGNKYCFNQVFSSMNKRAFLYGPDTAQEAFTAFVSRYERVIVKPAGRMMGLGVRGVDTARIEDMADFFEECRSSRCLLEEPICQHPVMAAIHPESVNTVRIVAARDDKRAVRIIGAALRCGRGNSIVDNFHRGGIAYPIGLLSGTVSGPGRDNTTLAEYYRHPDSRCWMPGLKIPNWSSILEAVYAGMALVPTLGYVGWDLAVTQDGAEVLEANYNWPGGNIIQFDRSGKYPAAKACMGRQGEIRHG